MGELIQKEIPEELQDALRDSGDLSIAPIVIKLMMEDRFENARKKIKELEHEDEEVRK